MPKAALLDISEFLNTAANYLRGDESPAAFLSEALARAGCEHADAAACANEKRPVEGPDPYRQSLEAMCDPLAGGRPARA